jgi:hypothetical protein
MPAGFTPMKTSAFLTVILHDGAGEDHFNVQSVQDLLQRGKPDRFLARFNIIYDGLSDAGKVRQLVSREAAVFSVMIGVIPVKTEICN